MTAPELWEADTLAAVEAFNEAFGSRDVDGVMECMTDDCPSRSCPHVASFGGISPGHRSEHSLFDPGDGQPAINLS